jgi:hypothetical protein
MSDWGLATIQMQLPMGRSTMKAWLVRLHVMSHLVLLRLLGHMIDKYTWADRMALYHNVYTQIQPVKVYTTLILLQAHRLQGHIHHKDGVLRRIPNTLIKRTHTILILTHIRMRINNSINHPHLTTHTCTHPSDLLLN